MGDDVIGLTEFFWEGSPPVQLFIQKPLDQQGRDHSMRRNT